MKRRPTCDPELARAFFKPQKYTERFSPMEALEKGTIFPELYCPYEYENENRYCGKFYPRRRGNFRYEV